MSAARGRARSGRRERGEPAHALREHGRLIEPPPPKARAIEWHRHNQVGVGKKLGSRLFQPKPEQWKTFVPIPIFEALDQLAHGRRIARRSARPVVNWKLGDGSRREQGLAGIVWQRHAEPPRSEAQ